MNKGSIIAILAVIIFSNFQPRPPEYRIVEGHLQYWPKETASYYLWDGSKTVTCSNQYEMLAFMQGQGFELVSTHSCEAGNDNGFERYKETWIFKK